jgi:hypothetical protein
MARHEVYACILKAVISRKLKEPFTKDEFRHVCPNFKEGTYNAFLWKHRVGNPGKNTELFIKVARGRFKLIRPFKYNISE